MHQCWEQSKFVSISSQSKNIRTTFAAADREWFLLFLDFLINLSCREWFFSHKREAWDHSTECTQSLQKENILEMLIIFVGDHLCRWRWTKWCKFDNDSNDDEYDQDNDHNEDDKIMIKMIKMTTKMKKIMSNRRQVCAVPQGSAGDRWGDHMM